MLVENMKLLMPLSPSSPDPGVQAISDALEVAMTVHIRAALIPGIGQTFIASLSSPNPFLLSLGAYLDAVITPIISSAAAVQATLGGPIPAWMSIQPSFDAAALAVPPFMAGPFGTLFWQAIVLTIRLAILPPIPSSGDEGAESDANTGGTRTGGVVVKNGE
jgi:hypothetical protein